MLRVWLPAGFSPLDALREGGYPALFLHDGQNLFDPELSISGACWRAAETAAQLIASGQLPPFVVVGIDHPGPARPYEYTPVKPGNGPDNWRPDAASWPGGGVWEYLERLAEEVVPWLTQAYALSPRACDRILGGSSFGGIATLCAAMRYPQVWGASLVESPSLWIDKGNFLATTITQHKGRWPARMFVGMGSQEHTGVRPPGAGRLEADEGLQGAALQLTATLAKQADLEEGRSLLLELQPGATHNEQAWADRLPRALAFLGRPWWQRQLRGKRGHLYFTVPRRLRPGVPAVLLVNKPRSTSLHAATSLELHHGYNMAWEVKPDDQPLRPAPWVEEGPDTWLTSTTEEPAAQPTTDSSTDKGDSQWWVAPLAVPSQAYEMHFALSGQVEVPGEQAGHSQQQKMWDSNAGHNFYMRVAPWTALDLLAVVPGSGDESQATRLERARQAVSSNPQPAADKNSNKPFFTLPEKLVAGGPCRVFFNRTRCWGLRHQPNIKLHYGWNGWDSKELPGGAAQVDLKPTQLWRNEDTDWWCAELAVPETAQELNFAFTNGGDVWDSNGGHNYVVRVVGGRGAGSGGGEGPVPRSVQHEEALPHGQGTMHIVTLARRAKGEVSQSKQMRWADEKVLRVWTPPGWSLEQTPPGGWPVLYLSDGQNKFEDWLAHQGVSWRAGYQASDLIAAGELPPFLVVGIDSPGPMRSFNYLPYEPGTGSGGFRGDAERWPGGGVSAYMQRVSEEIMPLVQSRFGAAADPDRNAFGGGSFGGVAALYAAMHYPHLFGSVLAESPSFWIAEGRFLADMAAHRGALPERLFLGCGTREYSATRDHCRPEVDALLLHYCSEAARILDEKGCKGEQGRLRFLVEEGAGHHEGAWQWRLSGALRFLLAPWWAHFRP
ncbi:Alpha/Beta hydrolase protein [Haematococcus lacustris]